MRVNATTPLAIRSGQNERNGDVTPGTLFWSAFTGSPRQILREFRACTAPDTKGASAARPSEHRLRFRSGRQSLPKLHIHGSLRNMSRCIRPSTLCARPLASGLRGQQRFLWPEWFQTLKTISFLVFFAPTEQKARRLE